MGIEQASNIGTVDDVLNMLTIQGVLWYFSIPLLVFLISIYVIRVRHAKKKKKKEEQKKVQKDTVKTTTVRKKEHMPSKKFPSTEVMMHMLDDIEEPLVKSDYSNLEIRFDKNGKMIKENCYGNSN